MTKHTPKPWRVNCSGSLEPDSMKLRPDNGKPYREYGCIAPVAPGGLIAHVYLGDGWPDDVDGALAEQEANARLIAAAPELLDILERLAEYWDQGAPVFPGSLISIEAREAIAKATGEPA